MKRSARFGLALLAVVAITVITPLVERSRVALYAWRPLPGGGELRLVAITHGSHHSLDLGGTTLRDRIRAAWQARSLSPLTYRASSGTSTHSSSSPSVAFWLEVRNLPKSEPPFVDGELVLPDGQIFRMRGRFGGSSRSGGAWLFNDAVMFPIIPARAKKLHFDVRINGALFVFEAPNPAYRTDLPVWKADPLPQTKRHGDVALTLRDVNVFHTTDWIGGTRADSHAQPLWTIRRGEFPADASYRIATVFEDPTGNVSQGIGLFSEPVWKVRATLTRTEDFPFVDDEVRWIGTIDPAIPEASTPQAYALLPRAGDHRAGRLKLVGVFGPGQFEIKNGVVTAAEPDSEAQPGIEWDSTRAVCIVRLARPAVLILEDPFAPRDRFDMRIFRDGVGSAVRLKERSTTGLNRLLLRVFDLPAKPLRLGLAKSDPFQLEFFLRAPARPSTSASNTSAR